MARSFILSSNESALVNVAPVSTYPFCIGVWLKKLGGSNTETLMFFGEMDFYSNAYTRIYISNLGKIVADSAHTGNSVTTTSVYDDDSWHACLLVERNSGGWRHVDLYVDGVFIGTASSTNSGGLSIFSRVAFGRRMTVTPGDALDGTLAEGFIADVAPTAEQVAAWSRGVSPRHIFGSAVKGYWPLWGLHSPEIDVSGQQNDLTLSGTARDNHAPVSPYTPRWAASFLRPDATTRLVSLDGVMIRVAA